MKKILSVVLALAMLCTVAPASVFALNDYVVYNGADGCRLTSLEIRDADNPWLLYDIEFETSENGRVYTSTKDHPNLIGTEAVLTVAFEGAEVTFNGTDITSGAAVTLNAKNELVVKDNNENIAEYTVIITEETNGLPVVLIDTENYHNTDPNDEDYRADYDSEDPIPDKLEYTRSHISVLGADIYDGKDILDAVCGIKLRGNSTMSYAKKPYRLKFESKENVLNLGKAKSWVLLADYLDPSGLRNSVAYNFADRIYKQTAKTTGFEIFSPRMKLVEVYLNGEFKGLYEMGDHMQANEHRVAINELGDEKNASDYSGEQIGYFIEFEVKSRVLQEGADGYADWSDYSYITEVGSAGKAQVIDEDDEAQYLINSGDIGKTALYFQFKLPEEPTDAHKAYITNYMQTVNNKFLQQDETVWDLVDMDSVINWYLINELFKNADSQMQSSVYFYKDGTLDEDGNAKANPDTKLYMAPVWDFDLGAGGVTYGDMNDPTDWRTRNDEYCGWFREMFETETFSDAVEARWAELHENGILEAITTDITALKDFVGEAALENFELWHETYLNEIDGTWMTVPEASKLGDWEAQTAYLQNWLTARIAWMDVQFGYSSEPTYQTETVKDTLSVLSNMSVVAQAASTSSVSKTIQINELIDRNKLALNFNVDSDCAYDIEFNVTVNTSFRNSNGSSFSFTMTPNILSDWPSLFDTELHVPAPAGSQQDVVATFSGAIEWKLKNDYSGTTGLSSSASINAADYVTKTRLNSITITQYAPKAGDCTTVSIDLFDQQYKNSGIDAVTGTTTKTKLATAPVIMGEGKVGNTLVLNAETITPIGASTTYQWYVNGTAIDNAVGLSYTVQPSDLGKNITVKATGNLLYTGTVTSSPVTITLDGTTQSAPNAAPTLASKTATTLTVNAVSGQEYSLDGITWTSNTTFSGLGAGEVYTVYARKAATATAPASDASAPLTVTLEVLPTVLGDVNASGKLDTKDVILALKQGLGFISLNGNVLALADFDESGTVTTSDARQILLTLVNTPS